MTSLASSTPERKVPVSPWNTPRGRFLAGLAGLAVVLVIAATLALMGERARTATRFAHTVIFPGLAAQLDSAGGVTVKTKESEIVLALGADNKWVARSLADYPVSGENVRLLLIGLSNLTAVEEKTAQPALHAALELGDPKDGGDATLVEVTDKDGKVLAALLAGKRAPAALEGEDRFYVRRAGEAQTYVATGGLPRSVHPADWLETSIVDIARDRVKSVALTPLEGPSFRISREKKDDANFTLENVPKGRAVLNDTAANPIGAALAGLTLDDVRKAGEVDFAKAAHDVFETFDGLTLTLDVANIDNDYWLRISAAGTGDAQGEADKINARVGGWAYKVSAWKGEVLMRELERQLQSLVPNAPKVDGDQQ